MKQSSTTTSDVTEALARLYIDELARAEGVETKSMMLAWTGRDEIADIIGDMESEPSKPNGPVLRVDLVLAAVLCARMIASEANLARRLRQESPVVVIQAHTATMALLVDDVIDKCATRKGARRLVFRDGTDARQHLPEKGNSEVIDALSSRHLIVGVAPDPRRHLPRALMRMAEYQLSIPQVDEWTIRLVLEAITGRPFGGVVDPLVLRQADITDFSLAFRRDLTPEQCLERLDGLIKTKRTFLGNGPALEDLHGYGEAKAWGLELAADLSEYRAGRLKWEEVDHKGLLLSGPPGVGKTSYAKALAKSADVPLIATSVAQWNASTFLSGTLQAIRDVFGEAKRAAPAILFIDELDGISSRERLRGEHVEYWSQVVNLLLECLAGIEDREGVVVVGATNHVDKIDPAVLRAGRMDHHIELLKPDVRTLANIFRHHVGPTVLSGHDLIEAALAARGGTGADVQAWVARAKARARRESRELTMADLVLQIRGSVPALSTAERKRVASHEAGHVVVARHLKTGEVVATSIVGRGGETEIAGALRSTDNEVALDSTLAFFLAGRAAEIETFGEASLGSGGSLPNNDLARATELATLAETSYGFGKTAGLVHLGSTASGAYQPSVEIFTAVRDRLDRALAVARSIVAARKAEVSAIAHALDDRGYLSASDIDEIVGSNPSKRLRFVRPRRATNAPPTSGRAASPRHASS